MINVVKRTGHSSYYVEKGMSAMGKPPKQIGLQADFGVQGGGERSSSLTRDFPPTNHSIPNLVGGISLSCCVGSLKAFRMGTAVR